MFDDIEYDVIESASDVGGPEWTCPDCGGHQFYTHHYQAGDSDLICVFCGSSEIAESPSAALAISITKREELEKELLSPLERLELAAKICHEIERLSYNLPPWEECDQGAVMRRVARLPVHDLNSREKMERVILEAICG